MLSDEEKKAIDKLKRSANYFVMPIYETKIILELIEKQSKEIEELKEKDDANLAYYDQIYQNGIYTGQKAVEGKIKAKIEEVDKDENASIPDFIEYAKEYATQKLQSLLEKE